MRTIAIINQKGGCGKTTSAINLAGILARSGFRTLLVDMDPQSHCAAGLAIPEERIDLDVSDLVLAGPEREVEADRLFWRVARNLDLIPSRMKLAGLEAMRGGLAGAQDKERRLASVLVKHADRYDVCLIDCSPSIGLLTYNALTSAQAVLIPVETGFFSLEGATKQANTVRTLSRRLGVEAPYWLVATIHDEASRLAADLLDELKRRFGDRVVPPIIRRDPALKEAASFGQPVIEYAPRSQGAQDYTALAQWLVEAAGIEGGSMPRLPEPGVLEPLDSFDTEPFSSAAGSTGTGGGGGRGVLADVEAKPAAMLAVPAADGPGPATRAEDVAAKARQLLLKRTEEQIGRLSALRAKSSTALATEPLPEPIPAAAAGRIEAVRSLFGVRVTHQGVLFVQPLTLGARVSVAGDFNAWSASSHPMRRNDAAGVFELCVPLPAGKYRYRLVIDGRWTPDPFNGTVSPNEFGEPDSLVTVAEAGGA